MGQLDQVMLYVDGSKSAFRCECGGNVFHILIGACIKKTYICNSCGLNYTGDNDLVPGHAFLPWQEVTLHDGSLIMVTKCIYCGAIFTRPGQTNLLHELLPELRIMAVEGARVDGVHHKQWYLAQIARRLQYDDMDTIDPGVAP